MYVNEVWNCKCRLQLVVTYLDFTLPCLHFALPYLSRVNEILPPVVDELRQCSFAANFDYQYACQKHSCPDEECHMQKNWQCVDNTANIQASHLRRWF